MKDVPDWEVSAVQRAAVLAPSLSMLRLCLKMAYTHDWIARKPWMRHRAKADSSGRQERIQHQEIYTQHHCRIVDPDPHRVKM